MFVKPRFTNTQQHQVGMIHLQTWDWSEASLFCADESGFSIINVLFVIKICFIHFSDVSSSNAAAHFFVLGLLSFCPQMNFELDQALWKTSTVYMKACQEQSVFWLIYYSLTRLNFHFLMSLCRVIIHCDKPNRRIFFRLCRALMIRKTVLPMPGLVFLVDKIITVSDVTGGDHGRIAQE